MIFLGVASSAVQFLVAGQGGIGLSGIGYGFFGLLLATRGSPRGPDYVLPHKVITLFIAWFFVCIALTQSQIVPVGNTAHAAGCVFGVC